MTATERIKRELEAYSKTLSPSDKVRWKHGYVDGLKTALKFLSIDNENTTGERK